MLSAVTGRMTGNGGKACVLAHRDELTSQNRAKFARDNPDMETSVVDATAKSWEGQVTFAMAPTLSRAANLQAMPKLDLLVIDEAHHAVAESYRRIIDRVHTTEKANEVQRRMLEAAARRPRNRNELVDRLRDGGF